MAGTTYSRGIRNSSSGYDGTAIYNIFDAHGFTRLTGTLGREYGSATGWLIVRAGTGKLLGGYVLNAGVTSMPIDVAIPSDVQQVHIQLQPGSSSRLGLGDAHFSNNPQYLPPMIPNAISGAVYLENDIFQTSSSNYYITSYPANGAFVMEGTTYFRGITNYYPGDNGTATYNIGGQGFTRLRGTLRRVTGTSAGTLVITGDGAQLGTFTLNEGYVTDNLDLTIPPNTQQIQIQLQPGSSSRLGLGDAYFSK